MSRPETLKHAHKGILLVITAVADRLEAEAALGKVKLTSGKEPHDSRFG